VCPAALGFRRDFLLDLPNAPVFGTESPVMRSKLIWLVLVTIGCWAGCRKATTEAPARSDVLFRFHFVGGAQLASDTNAARWNGFVALPATCEVRDQTLRKLAKAPYQLFKNRVAATTNDYAEMIRPLLDDLLGAESYAELRDDTNQTPEFALAVRLDAVRAEVWRTNLATVLAAWTGSEASPIEVDGCPGWELKKERAPNAIRFVRAGQWVVVGSGQDQLPLQADLLRRIRVRGGPMHSDGGFWFEAWMDWARLEPHLPVVLPARLPQMRLTLTGSGGNLRTKMDLLYAEPIRQEFEPWRIPTNTIHEPLISFTAGRGMARWLGQLKQVQGWKLDSLPDQFFLWAIADIPFQTFLAVPSADATNYLERLAPQIVARFSTNLQLHSCGTFNWSTNTSRLAWEGLPALVPFLEPVREPTGQFLFLGFFPNSPLGKPPPAELLREFASRSKLVYYDWEITEQRGTQWQVLSQLYQMAFDKPLLGINAASIRWLNAIGTGLGNTVTEITVTGPKQLTLVRKGPIGLTGFELVALANWLESPKFPLGDYRLPARSNEVGSGSAKDSSHAETRR
jgi:hypothetical protein